MANAYEQQPALGESALRKVLNVLCAKASVHDSITFRFVFYIPNWWTLGSAGLFFVLGGCLCSGFAVPSLLKECQPKSQDLTCWRVPTQAVYLEKLVKQKEKTERTSMWIQNMQLAAWQNAPAFACELPM